MLNLCWSNTKRFLSVFAVFGKFFVFAKNVKISKNSVAFFQRLSRGLVQSHVPVACPHRFFSWLTGGSMPSHEKYLEYFSKFGFLMFLTTQSGDLFAGGRSSRKKAQRFSRLISRLSHRQNFQSQKTFRKIFQIFVLSVLATSLGDFLAT